MLPSEATRLFGQLESLRGGLAKLEVPLDPLKLLLYVAVPLVGAIGLPRGRYIDRLWLDGWTSAVAADVFCRYRAPSSTGRGQSR